MEARLRLSKHGASPAVNPTKYIILIGSLRYLLHMRPDLMFIWCYPSRFMEQPRQEHMVAMKRVLRYIVGTTELGLIYPRGSGGSKELLGYSDSDMAGDVNDRRARRELSSLLAKGR
jgi:hypothetical protein